VAVSVPKALLFCYIIPVKEMFKKYYASKSETFSDSCTKKSSNLGKEKISIVCKNILLSTSFSDKDLKIIM
jgi:hypothetical protein